MPKFLVINAEAEAQLKDPVDTGDTKRFETKHISASNILHTIQRALEAAFHQDDRVTFERLREGWAFRVHVKLPPVGSISSYVVRVQKERP